MKWMLLLVVMSAACAGSHEKAVALAPLCLVDPVLVSPEVYRVIREDAQTREIRLRSEPGVRDQLHGHYQGEWTVLQGGKGRLHDDQGNHRDVTLKAGMKGTQARTIAHAFENIGDTLIEVQMIETKSKEIDWCQSALED